MSTLNVSLGSLQLSSPIMAASGCYGYGLEYADVANPSHLGGFITKSISPERWKGNPPPRLAETEFGLLNSIGLANMGVDAFIQDVLPRITNFDTKVIVSVACKVMEEYELVVRKLEEVEGVDGYELNISCPNVKEGGMAFSQNPKLTEELVSRVRAISNRWITAKLTPNTASIKSACQAAEQGGANALSLINTIVGMAVDYKSRRPKLATLTGGYSGPPIKPVALARVWEGYNAVDIPIVGIGGIVSWQDVVEFFIVGASAVQVGSALYTNPGLPAELNQGLLDYMKSERIDSLSELTGTLKTDQPFQVGAPV
ncbi:dihydroorotate dehydrogenase [bacterium]|nr:dihydroorotate dehydrogenase [bacterium]